LLLIAGELLLLFMIRPPEAPPTPPLAPPPRRVIVSSSSGVGGSGLLGPFAGSGTPETRCSALLLTPLADGRAVADDRIGSSSRSGFGFRSEALMVPSFIQ
jgi:hypothetical protein